MFRKNIVQLLPAQLKLPDFKKLPAGRKIVASFALLFLVSFVLQLSFQPAVERILTADLGTYDI